MGSKLNLLFFLVLFCAAHARSEGPLYRQKDTFVQQEFDNVYSDLRRKIPGVVSGSALCIDNPTFCVDTSKHIVVVTTGTAAAPSITFNGRTTDGFFSNGAGLVGITAGGVLVAEADSSQGWNISDGQSITIPGLRFINEGGLGMRRNGAHEIDFVSNGGTTLGLADTSLEFYVSGNRVVELIASSFWPVTDNTYHLGNTGHRWVDVWAVNGTVQTSDSSTKKNIQNLDPKTLPIPSGVTYQRLDGDPSGTQTFMGFLADGLPDSAYAVNADGTPNKKFVYTSAVIGIVCSKLADMEARLETLEKK